jgi:hypothetical protein
MMHAVSKDADEVQRGSQPPAPWTASLDEVKILGSATTETAQDTSADHIQPLPMFLRGFNSSGTDQCCLV